MIEPEVPFCDLEGDMDLAEAFVKSLVAAAQNDCGEDMEFFAQRIDKTLPETLRTIAESEFVRLPYTEAIALLKGCGQTFRLPPGMGRRPANRARTVSDGNALQGAGDSCTTTRRRSNPFTCG